jgi:hypothetical protein
MRIANRLDTHATPLIVAIATAALAILSPVRSGAQSIYDLSWSTVGSGGGTTGGGTYALAGSIAQPTAGAHAGGAYQLMGGFWAFEPSSPTSVDGPEYGSDGAPLAFRLHPGAPNPFARATTIAFDLPSSSPARVDVYNVSGALVRTLLDRPVNAGRHTVTWRGDDERGNDVAQGVYVMRLEAGAHAATTKVVLTR